MLIKFRWTYSCISINVLVLINVNRLLDINLWAHYHSQGLNKRQTALVINVHQREVVAQAGSSVFLGFSLDFELTELFLLMYENHNL